MGGCLKLRRGVVVAADPLEVEVGGERRRAWADEVLLGEMREGDEVVVNVAALDLALGSGGFDVVHVNLTRGLEGGGEGEAHVMKLNYTSLQHPVEPVEELPRVAEPGRYHIPSLVLPLHGHLAPAAWALSQENPNLKVGYVQTWGGALPGSLSRDVRQLQDRAMLCGHITAGSSYGGEYEAMNAVGAIDAACNRLCWDVILIGPGPGIIGSETIYGHGGMAALSNVFASQALHLPTTLCPRLSAADPRSRHQGLSHHTHTVLDHLLDYVSIVVPEGFADARAGLERAAEKRHNLVSAVPDLEGYVVSGLPTRTMGRTLAEDPLFFAAPLAAGRYIGRRTVPCADRKPHE